MSNRERRSEFVDLAKLDDGAALDTTKLSGLRKWQMFCWLIFEDSTYSCAPLPVCALALR